MSAGPSRHSAITCQSNIYLALHISPFVGRAQHADEVFGSDRPTKRVLALRAYQKPPRGTGRAFVDPATFLGMVYSG